MSRDFIGIIDLSDDDLDVIYEAARPAMSDTELAGWAVALVFEHPSLRTRASSVAAVQGLGAHLVQFTGDEVGIDTRESAEDIARTLRATSDILALRVRDHGVFSRMADATDSQLRLINLLSNHEHPTQAVADVLTLADHFANGDVHQLAGRHVAFVGDGANNVARSLSAALVRLGVHVHVGAPQGYQMGEEDLATLRSLARVGGTLSVHDSPTSAATGAHALYTDVWTSMGEETERDARRRALSEFQVNAELVALASPDAVVLHCLPAHRGEEITADVLESPRCLVWKQVRHRTSSMVGVVRWMKEGQR